MRSAITFDFHNTLIHCDEWFDLEVRDMPARVGAVLSLAVGPGVTQAYRDLRREVMGHGVEVDAVAGVIEAWRRVGTALAEQDVRPVVDQLMRDVVSNSALVPGVAGLLSELRSWDVPVGVISSAVHDSFLRWALEHHGVIDVFVDVVSSAEAGFYKSNPEIYRIAYRRLGADPASSVHIGDSFAFDHLSAGEVGASTIWLNTTGERPPADKPKPTAEVSSMDDVRQHLELLLANTTIG